MFLILLYFLLGLVIDVLITLHTKSVILDRRLFAAILSSSITLVSMLIIQNIIVSNSLYLIISYALGTGFGTFIGMCLKKITNNKK